MTQSHQTKHSSYYDPHQHHHHKHHRKHSGSNHSKDEPSKGKLVKHKSEEKPEIKKPAERPWSNWIAGDDGRYYYRARQSSGGFWEYAFMEPRGDLQQGSAERMPYTGPAIAMAAGPSSGTFAEYLQEGIYVDYPEEHGPGVAPTQMAPKPKAVGFPAAKAVDGKAKAKGKAYDGEHKGWGQEKPLDKKSKKKQSKKLGSVVQSERGKKFNHKTIVQGWLDEYESSDPGEE